MIRPKEKTGHCEVENSTSSERRSCSGCTRLVRCFLILWLRAGKSANLPMQLHLAGRPYSSRDDLRGSSVQQTSPTLGSSNSTSWPKPAGSIAGDFFRVVQKGLPIDKLFARVRQARLRAGLRPGPRSPEAKVERMRLLGKFS